MSMAVTGWACGATGDRIALADLVTPARAGMMPRAAAHHVEHAARVASAYRSSPHRPVGRVVTRRRSNVAGLWVNTSSVTCVGHHLVGDLGDRVFDWAAPFRFELAVLGGRPTHHSAPSQVNAGIPHLDSTASWRSQFSLMHIIFGPDNAYLRDQSQLSIWPRMYVRSWG
jgi:hypothetical protein